MRHPLMRLSAAVVAAGLLLAGCARDGGDDQPTGTEDTSSSSGEFQVGFFPNDDAGDPQRGGTLTFAEYSETRSFDPSVIIPAAAAGGNSMVALYDQIARQDPETGKFEPRMAESITPSDDFSEWTIKLKPNINFSDGTPLNADAVVGSMTWYMSGRGFDVGIIGPMWKGVEKVDDMTVKITLQGGWATFDSMLSRALGFIVAPAAIAGGPENFKPIGAGAWLVGDYAPGEHLTFKPNPNHWDGAPYLDELRFVWLGGDRTKYEAFTGGSVNGSFINNPEITREIADKDLPRHSEWSSNALVVLINHREGFPGHNDKVRKAMALAIDPEQVNQRVFNGKGFPGKTMFSNGSVWHHEGVPQNPVDPAAATKLVEEAKAEGFDGTIQIIGGGESSESIMALQAMWEAVGFTVEVDIIRNIADMIAKIYVERNFSMAVSGLSAQDVDPYQNLFSSLNSSSASNVGGYNDPEMDKLLTELRETPLDQAQDVMDRIEARYSETVPYITYGYYTPTIVWAKDVHGVDPAGMQGLVDFGKAWIKK